MVFFNKMNCCKVSILYLIKPFKACNTMIQHMSTSSILQDKHCCRLLVIGGGCGGCSIAAKFAYKMGKKQIIVVEPAETHYFQSMFTLIGGGIKHLCESCRPMKEVLPKDVLWIKDHAIEIDPQRNEVVTCNGTTIEYDMMILATGIDIDFKRIPGLVEGLEDSASGVCSIYSPLYVTKTFPYIQQLQRGNAIFTYPNSRVKCGGAGLKIAYLTSHHAQMNRKKDIQVIYHTTLPVIFLCSRYEETLWKVAKKRNVQVHLNSELIEIRPDRKEAVFLNLNEPNEKTVEDYHMLHVVPPHVCSPLISQNELLSGNCGYLKVDKGTLQHCDFPNIFGIGDCTNLPTSKTAAAVAGQLGVLKKNVTAVMEGKDPKELYDGYTACPLITGYGTCIMAEFGYDHINLETFPFDQNKERLSMYLVEKYFFDPMYFHLMLRGLWNGPGAFRKFMHKFKHD